NTFVGENAGFETTTGGRNTFIGSRVAWNNTTGYRNTAVGNIALFDLTTGHHNTAVGDSSGNDNSTGTYNTFFGSGSGAANEHADFNTFIGAYAGYNNNRSNGTGNANRNTYVGYRAGYTNWNGEDNVGMGAYADFNNTNLSRTTFLGGSADPFANDVVVIGVEALASEQGSISLGAYSDVTGGNSIGIGYLAQGLNDDGVVIGDEAVIQNGATHSVAIGRQATINGDFDQSIVIGSQSASTGGSTVAIGYAANTSATYATAIGHSASASGVNSMALGNGASVTADNEVYLGNNAITSIGSMVNWTAASDGRFKKNIRKDVPGTEFIDGLRAVTYNFDVTELDEFRGMAVPDNLKHGYEAKNEIRYSGFIAQEVEELAGSLGYEFNGVDAPQHEQDVYGLRYAEFVVPLVKTLQELHQRAKTLESKIELRNAQVSAYQQILSKLEKRLVAMESTEANKLETMQTTADRPTTVRNGITMRNASTTNGE
ncbi:MAG: hypothetical protein GY727_04690, partial [Gammaproteobacteria bacterium]|nr:hypothetical protein [Gammaproteobacteria bacterium]